MQNFYCARFLQRSENLGANKNNDNYDHNKYINTLYFNRVNKIYKKQFSSRKLGVLTVAFGDLSITGAWNVPESK